MHIPAELKRRNQWVCYRLEPDPGGSKPKKVPVDPVTGKRAMVNNPVTWTDYETAWQAKNQYCLAGIGFVLTAGDNLVAVDIDHCIDQDSGEISDIATDILSRHSTYAEYSPSGTGLHIWYLGEKPKGSCKNSENGVEMYDRARYMTVTGNRIEGCSKEITEDKHHALESIHKTYLQKKAGRKITDKKGPAAGKLNDDGILKMAASAGNAKTFRDLWEGRWQDHYPSQSEADMALLMKLAFWSGNDKEQMDRMFRTSGLYREKWDEKHYSDGSTYGEETIRKAIEKTGATYQSGTGDTPIFEYEDRYFRMKGESIYPITNFIIKPVEMIISEEETQLTADFVTVQGETFRQKLLTTHFDNHNKFRNLLNTNTIALSFLGSDSDLELFKLYVSQLDWTKKTGVKAMGIYDHEGGMIFVTEDGSIAYGGEKVDSVLQLQRHVSIRSNLITEDLITPRQLEMLGTFVLDYNEPEKTVSILGWTAGCFLKEHLRLSGIKYPMLFLIGEAGSGKSTTMERIILPVFSCDHIIASTQITPFTLMKESASSNLVPMSLDEFKPSKMDRMKLNALYNHFRDSYDGHDGIRGRADQSIVTYHLLAPIVIAGEESPDEAAIRERSIELLFSKKDLRNREYKAGFESAMNNPKLLNSFGRSLLETALTVNTGQARDWYLQGNTFFHDLPSRVISNLSCCYAGLRLVQALCQSAGFRWNDIFHIGIEPCITYMDRGARDYLLDGGNNNASIVEQSFEIMARMGLDPLNEYYLDQVSGRLYIRLSKVYDKYTKYRKDYAIAGEVLPYAQFKKQLLHSDIVIDSNIQRKFNGKNARCWVINYRALLEHGLDVSGFETDVMSS